MTVCFFRPASLNALEKPPASPRADINLSIYRAKPESVHLFEPRERQ